MICKYCALSSQPRLVLSDIVTMRIHSVALCLSVNMEDNFEQHSLRQLETVSSCTAKEAIEEIGEGL